MSRFLLKIAYDGTAYHGWQVQPNGITVQAVLCDALFNMCKSKISVTGCSRTDAGVHANEFFCHFDTNLDIPETAFVKGLNAILPDDISVLSCNGVSDDFHARYSAKGKNYLYRFYDGKTENPFYRRYALSVQNKLNVDLMNEYCSRMVGTHDFSGFSSSKRTVTDTVRTISECKVYRDGDFVVLSVTADGFLYNMVRIIAGTALQVSLGKINPLDTEKIIQSKNRDMAGATLLPHGLYLNKVIY
ncbi:MAG: tRNA pseudouridine(38-40) synthase TruA [Ruminococcaceae bacterium]|nr:tRNA pseudouridine(38-40) synthase TruA [Oscillospiraceae bacterium]